MPIYFPWAFRIPKTRTTPHATPTTKEPEVTAKAHKDAATPDTPLTISLLGLVGAWFAGGLGHTSPGFGVFFGISFATADNTGVSSVTPKIPRTVVKPKSKDFRFDLGWLLASSNFSLNFWDLFLRFASLLPAFFFRWKCVFNICHFKII